MNRLASLIRITFQRLIRFVHTLYNLVPLHDGTGRKETVQMTVNDYLEFVGSGMMMTALKAFGKNTGCSLRYEWKKPAESAPRDRPKAKSIPSTGNT